MEVINLIHHAEEPTRILVEYEVLKKQYVQLFKSRGSLKKFTDKNFNAKLLRTKKVLISEADELLEHWHLQGAEKIAEVA